MNQRGDARVQRGVKLEDIFTQIQAGEVATLNVIVKADVHGSLEAVTESLRKLERDRAATLNATQAQTLRDEIRLLELKYFGPSANDAREADLNEVVERWSKAAK